MSNKESTLGTFIMMMEQFISEMVSTFPNEAKLKVYSNSFDLIKKTNPRKVLDLFMDSVAPYMQKIIQRDESMMLDDTVPLNKELNLKNIWESPGITDSTKDAIWSHLNTLLMFGTTLKNIPSELMNSIEKLASQYSGSMNDGGLDPNLLMSGLQSMMGKMSISKSK
jgi:hypothetical protein